MTEKPAGALPDGSLPDGSSSTDSMPAESPGQTATLSGQAPDQVAKPGLQQTRQQTWQQSDSTASDSARARFSTRTGSIRQPLIRRYTANERSNHWVTAITFVLLALSGLSMFHPSMFWMSALFGGGQWTRILHPYIGLVMFLSFAMLVVRFWHHNMIDRDDVRWLMKIEDVLNNREENLPPVGRYNAGQKLLFFTLIGCLLLLLLSGIVIWRAWFSFYFPIPVIRVAAVLHAFAAFVLIVSIIVHIYAALWVKGSIGAMVRGTVTLGWARKHHPRWFHDVIDKR